MDISVITFSKKLSTHEHAWIDTYSKRLQHFCSFNILRYPEDQCLEKIFKKRNDNAFIIALDEHAKQLSSKQLAKKITQHQQHHLYFIIGGSYGLPKDIKTYAKETLSLSNMTLPHRMALLVLTEQLYRAQAINNNLPYHHE